MDGTQGKSWLCVCCPEAVFFTGVLVSHRSGEHSQKGRDTFMKAQQLYVKVVGCPCSLPGTVLGEGISAEAVASRIETHSQDFRVAGGPPCVVQQGFITL